MYKSVHTHDIYFIDRLIISGLPGSEQMLPAGFRMRIATRYATRPALAARPSIISYR